MMNSVFRRSIDLHELLLITRHCTEQREKLAKQRARLCAQQCKLQEAQGRMLLNVITDAPVVRVQKLTIISEIVWFAKVAC